MNARKLIAQFDFFLFGVFLLLAIIGLSGIYSASTSHGADSGLFARQLVWIGLGIVVCLVVLSVDYHFLIDHAFLLYGVMILTLIGVLIFGSEINGSKSWVRFAGFGFQPSELAKIVIVLALARYLSELRGNFLSQKNILTLAGITLGPVVLVTMQGDLGTGLTYFPIMLGTVVVAGLRLRFLVGVLLLTILVAPVGWFTLKDYQKQRILVTFDPELDPHGVGYQTKQSLIAIGSGGLTGKGLGEGKQSQLGFVPAIHSDFIFALLSEERGFLGAATILLLYLFALVRIVGVGETARDRAGILIVTGIASLICFHLIINVGMTLGIMPAIGIPLPLLSYGGSSTLSFFAALGLVLNVHSRRFVYSEHLISFRPLNR